MEFERKVEDIEEKIKELEIFSAEKGIPLGEEIQKLKDFRDQFLEEIYKEVTDWDKVSISRHPMRPHTVDYIEYLVEDFVELHGDRLFRDDPAIVGGLGKIDGKAMMIIGHEKGRGTEDKIKRNFGMANPEGYRKALRLFHMAERFHLPVFVLIDTAGAYPGLEAEQNGQGEAIARNLMEMSDLKTPIISVVIGEGGSGGAIGLGVADKVYMLEYSIYSVISPEGCAAILFKDSSKAPEAAQNLKISAQNLLRLGVIDGIVPESLGGAHRDPKRTAINLKNIILSSFQELEQIPLEDLLENRYNKFRKMGKFKTKIEGE